jgi:putative transposase
MYDINYKLSVIISYFKTLNCLSTSKIFNVARSTIKKWQNEYIEKNIKLKYTRFIKNIEENQKILEFTKKLVKSNPYITYYELKLKIKEQFNIQYYDHNIRQILKKLNLTRKKVKYIHKIDENKLKYITNRKKEYYDKIKNININKIISIDESAFIDNNLNYNYGLSEKGTKIYDNKNIYGNNKYSLLMAITSSKILNYNLYDTNINSNIFNIFIDNLIKKEKLKGYTFIMDNVAFHKNKNLISIIESSENYLLFIPPYSPDYNPIENLFSIIKNKVKKQKNNKIINNNIFEQIIIYQIEIFTDDTYFFNIFKRSIDFYIYDEK